MNEKMKILRISHQFNSYNINQSNFSRTPHARFEKLMKGLVVNNKTNSVIEFNTLTTLTTNVY